MTGAPKTLDHSDVGQEETNHHSVERHTAHVVPEPPLKMAAPTFSIRKCVYIISYKKINRKKKTMLRGVTPWIFNMDTENDGTIEFLFQFKLC